MTYDFQELTSNTRFLMGRLLEDDISDGTLYLYKRLTTEGKDRYPKLLHTAIESGNERTLAESLVPEYFMKFDKPNVPLRHDMNRVLADAMFNFYYMRAIASMVVEVYNRRAKVKVYRANLSRPPLITTEEMIGKILPAQKLLVELTPQHVLVYSGLSLHRVDPWGKRLTPSGM